MSPLPDISLIQSLRRRLNITQKQLADVSKVSQSLISRIERGALIPTYDNAKRILDALERLEMDSLKIGPHAKRGPSLVDKIRNCSGVIGIADTTFSNIDTASIAIDEIRRFASKVTVRRYTVPGIRDLPLACKLLIEREKCGAVLATGMVSKKGVAKDVETQALFGIMMVQLLTNVHVITAFYDEAEGRGKRLHDIVTDRTRKHALNVLRLLASPDTLTDYAGLGLRQGSKHVGRLRV